MADRIHRALAAPVLLNDHEAVPSASVGVALSLTPYERAEDVVRDADAAMYRAKQEGGGRWEICDEAMRERVASRARMQHDLRRALEHAGAHRPVPAGGRPRHRRAARVRGACCAGAALLLPLDFLVAAEEAAGILRIEAWLLREACAQAGRWRARYGLPFRLSLDVSTAQFLRPRAGRRAARRPGLRAGSPAPPSTLEVTEDTLLRDASAVAAAFGAVSALGVGVVLDRFGSGQGSINALRRFRLRALKLDAPLAAAGGSGDGGAPSRPPRPWPPPSPFPSPPPASRRRRSARACRPWAARKGRAAISRSRWTRERRKRSCADGHGALPALGPAAVRVGSSTPPGPPRRKIGRTASRPSMPRRSPA